MKNIFEKLLLVFVLILVFTRVASGEDSAIASYADGVLIVNDVRYEMVALPAGKFLMGSDSGTADEKPAHLVQLDAFSLGRMEVTRGLWRAVLGENIEGSHEDDNFPQDKISWDDCSEFIKILNDLTGGNFRLPTEAEWEYACRAGTSGNSYSDLDDIAWYEVTSGGEIHAVGQKQPNVWGLYDMLGNVWEYCLDRYKEDYYSRSPLSGTNQGVQYKIAVQNPRGPSSGVHRVIRGGGSHSRAEVVRAYNRSMVHPGAPYKGIGFRLVSGS